MGAYLCVLCWVLFKMYEVPLIKTWETIGLTRIKVEMGAGCLVFFFLRGGQQCQASRTLHERVQLL